MGQVRTFLGKRMTLVCSTLLLAAIVLVPIRLLSLSSLAANGQQTVSKSSVQGYRAAAYFNGYFFAAGDGGRLDRISTDNQVETLPTPTTENLTAVLVSEDAALACGEKGTLLYSEDGIKFGKCRTGTHYDLYGLTFFNGSYFASGARGTLLESENGKTWKTKELDTKNNVIAIASNANMMMAITSESDVFTSNDGKIWKHSNFNTTYAGYYEPCKFTNISSLGDTFCITGYQDKTPGKPYIIYSETGEVWMEKPLSEINHKAPDDQYPLTIHAIVCDTDQILAACDNGRILTVTNCAVCNQLTKVTDQDLRTIAYGDGKLLVAGEGFFADVIDSSQTRQYQIKAEQALSDVQAGAIIIDVRDDSERKETGYITGSIHIPLSEIKDALPQTVPDRQAELIFYCAKGVRAQKALETALELGYVRVYNLGGLSDWPYGITK